MPDTSPDQSPVDPDRDRGGNPFDRKDGFYGQDYNREREAELGAEHPSGTVAARPGDPVSPRDPAIPSENGRRASFDPHTGAVHGSGSSAGGGNPGEDFASDAAGGEGYPITGAEGIDKTAPSDLGPPRGE